MKIGDRSTVTQSLTAATNSKPLLLHRVALKPDRKR